MGEEGDGNDGVAYDGEMCKHLRWPLDWRFEVLCQA